MIVYHREFFPSFDLLKADQEPVCLYTVLSINELAGDCAAYSGIGPTMGRASQEEIDDLLERIRAGGTKISAAAARALFSEIEEKGLRYRI